MISIDNIKVLLVLQRFVFYIHKTKFQLLDVIEN